MTEETEILILHRQGQGLKGTRGDMAKHNKTVEEIFAARSSVLRNSSLPRLPWLGSAASTRRRSTRPLQ